MELGNLKLLIQYYLGNLVEIRKELVSCTMAPESKFVMRLKINGLLHHRWGETCCMFFYQHISYKI